MNASHVEERRHFVVLKLTAEEALQIADSISIAAGELRAVGGAGIKNERVCKVAAGRLEVFLGALGIALAQLPKEGE